MKKIVFAVILVITAALVLSGCVNAATPSASPVSTVSTSPAASATPDETPVSVATLAGPTGMGMIKLFSDSSYSVSLYQTPDQITPKIINGEVDVAAVPSNLAAVLYSKTKGAIKTVAVNTTGVLYILENGETINSLSDLSGKTIYATGQGATPEYVLDKLLNANGITNVDIQFMGAHADLANAMAAGTVKLALLPEPFVSTVLAKNSSVKVKIDINEEWQKIYGESSSIPMGVVVVSNKFAGNKAAMDKLIADYSASVQYAVTDANAPADIAAQSIVGSAAIAQAALPRCGITFTTGAQCKAILSDYFNLMFEANPASVGGALPDDAFYYMP